MSHWRHYDSTFVQQLNHDDVIKWIHFPRNWPFVRRIHRSPVNSPHKGQWRGALMFSLICIWINDWVNKREAGYVRRYRAHSDVTVMILLAIMETTNPGVTDPLWWESTAAERLILFTAEWPLVYVWVRWSFSHQYLPKFLRIASLVQKQEHVAQVPVNQSRGIEIDE